MKRISQLEDQINEWDEIAIEIDGLRSLLELDDGSLTEELEASVTKLESILAEKEVTILLSGQYDQGNALLAIHAGAGGTDSQDWAAMLERIYLRWAELKGYKTADGSWRVVLPDPDSPGQQPGHPPGQESNPRPDNSPDGSGAIGS